MTARVTLEVTATAGVEGDRQVGREAAAVEQLRVSATIPQMAQDVHRMHIIVTAKNQDGHWRRFAFRVVACGQAARISGESHATPL